MHKIVAIRTGDKYDWTYPWKLEASLRRQTTKRFVFELITQTKHPGWWGKLELFPPKERIVFLDLDLVITNNVDFLFEYDGPFCIARNALVPDRFDSSVMSISAGYGANVREYFERYAEQIMGKWQNDQYYLEDHISDADFWPDGKILSYKFHCKDNTPNGAAIVNFHGDIKPHQVTHLHFVQKYWQ